MRSRQQSSGGKMLGRRTIMQSLIGAIGIGPGAVKEITKGAFFNKSLGMSVGAAEATRIVENYEKIGKANPLANLIKPRPPSRWLDRIRNAFNQSYNFDNVRHDCLTPATFAELNLDAFPSWSENYKHHVALEHCTRKQMEYRWAQEYLWHLENLDREKRNNREPGYHPLMGDTQPVQATEAGGY